MQCKVAYDKEFEKLAERAMIHWGNDSQIKMMCEESAELIKALLKLQRKVNGSRIEEAVEEMVDVEIMLGQMKVLFNNNRIWRDMRAKKFARLQELLPKTE